VQDAKSEPTIELLKGTVNAPAAPPAAPVGPRANGKAPANAPTAPRTWATVARTPGLVAAPSGLRTVVPPGRWGAVPAVSRAAQHTSQAAEHFAALAERKVVTPFESWAPRAAAPNGSRADQTPAQAAYEARRTARKARSTAAVEPATLTSGVSAAKTTKWCYASSILSGLAHVSGCRAFRSARSLRGGS